MQILVPNTKEYSTVKEEILERYGVLPTAVFNPFTAIRTRIEYLKEFLLKTERKGYVLGISGGVDSSTAGRLCQIACQELRAKGYLAKFTALRLPAGVQFDEEDAKKALRFIDPDQSMSINIGECANNLSMQGVTQYTSANLSALSPQLIDYHKGNIKARLRMVAQYQIAALSEALVLGTDHNAECVMGFYTLHGDGACDLTVLNGLNKRQIRLMAKELGAPKSVYEKAPTADLEELKPGKLDDEGFGFDYTYLDDFLEGLTIPLEVEQIIINTYNKTRFKRMLPPGFNSKSS